MLDAQSTKTSNYIDIADYYITNKIKTKLQAERSMGIHWNEGAEKVWDIYEQELLHKMPEEKAPKKTQQQFKYGYVVRAQKYGYPSALQREMRRIASTRSVYFATFEDGKIVRLQRVKK